MRNKFLTKRSRELRQRMTLSEKILWQILRSSNFAGLRFRRQHPVGQYIVDFCCFQKKLIIELDGEYHNAIKQEDANRDCFLKEHGFRVLHFTNEHVFDHLERTLKTIAGELAIDGQKHYHECISSVRFPKKLCTLFLGLKKHREQMILCNTVSLADGQQPKMK